MPLITSKTQTEEEVFYALLDSCPHKKVALSEGRITSGGCGSNKFIQCSYHGWAFDGNGKCVEIPQTVIAKRDNAKKSSAGVDSSLSPKQQRQDATAVAITQAQGMVWIHPALTPLDALALEQEGNLVGPPRIPEIDMEGYKTTVAVRDFPIDWTVLMENIMDPDHGYFAHSSSGTALAFDWYASDGTENMIHIQEEFTELPSGPSNRKGGVGWKITSSVNAVDKLVKYNREERMKNGITKDSNSRALLVNKPKKNDPPKLATTTFIAPSIITLGRRTNITSPSQFLTGFWICPVGTGKSRFMSAAISKSPIPIPRWLVHMNLNNFLDQDTYLLVGQNRAVLKKEAECCIAQSSSNKMNSSVTSSNSANVRKSTYVYRSPSERMGVRIGQFFDATLSRVPNRKEALLSWYNRNSNGYRFFEEWPSREVTLDRFRQHTSVCPDSLDVVRNCESVMKTSKFIGAAFIFLKIMSRSSPFSLLQDSFSYVFPTSIYAAKQILIQVIAKIMMNRLVLSLLSRNTFYAILSLLALSHWIAYRVKREFFFKFDDALHRKDVKHIAKNWVDL
eukprot:CCRYP_004820-RA/>CCRYP_004820-RA protein AED:0.00 eAED:0.00 QI:531/1/1/1/1/1/2/278/563